MSERWTDMHGKDIYSKAARGNVYDDVISAHVRALHE